MKVIGLLSIAGALWLFAGFRVDAATAPDKFSLWKEPSFFRGAAMHPYNPYSDSTEGVRFVTKEDFAALKNQGANVVSLNYPGPFRAEPPYAFDSAKLKWLDDAILWAEEAGLYVVIHFRNGPGKSDATFADGADEVLWYSTRQDPISLDIPLHPTSGSD